MRLLSFKRHGLRLPAGITGTESNATLIVNNQSLIPGTNVRFQNITFPAISDGNVAFGGQGGSGANAAAGNFVSTQGGLQASVMVGDPVPNLGGVFTDVGMPAIAESTSCFIGSGSTGSSGVYFSGPAGLSVVADTSTQMPDTDAPFDSFGQSGGSGSGPSYDGTNAVFVGVGGGVAGVYAGEPGILSTVADTMMAAPGTQSTFTSFWAPDISGELAVFFGSTADIGAGRAGIYTSDGANLFLIANLGTQAPDGSGPFSAFGQPAISGSFVVFRALTQNGLGIYSAPLTGGTLTTVASLATDAPGGTPWKGFPEDPSVSGSTIGFEGIVVGAEGIYVSLNGTITDVIDTNVTIGGQTINYFGFASHQLSGNTIAFWVLLMNGTYGIYIIPAS